jgi:hypothetical protein
MTFVSDPNLWPVPAINTGCGQLAFGFRILEQRSEIMPFHLPGKLDSGKAEDCGYEIDAANGVLHKHAFGNTARKTNHQWGTDVGVVGGYFGAAEAVLSPRQALVRREDDECVLALSSFFQRVEQALDSFIERKRGFLGIIRATGYGPSIRIDSTRNW